MLVTMVKATVSFVLWIQRITSPSWSEDKTAGRQEAESSVFTCKQESESKVEVGESMYNFKAHPQ